MINAKNEIIVDLIALIVTVSLLGYFSRTIFGLVTSVIIGILAMLVTHLVISNGSLFVRLNLKVTKVSTYTLLALIYAVLLILVLSLHMSGTVSSLTISFEDWQIIPLQSYFLMGASIGITFFLPGYFILRIIDKDHLLSNLDSFVFSFLLSCFYTPLLGLISLFFMGYFSSIFYLLVSLPFLAICILYHFFKTKGVLKKEDSTFHLNPLLILVIFVFLIALFVFSKSNGYFFSDIWIHQGYALSAIRYGLDAVKIPLNWINLSFAWSYTLSGFPVINSTLILNSLQIMPIIAFYCMVKQVIRERSTIIASIAVVFFSLFSGLGWIFVLSKLPYETMNAAINQVAPITANDTLFTNIWSLPGLSPALGVGFTAFFALLYLLFCRIKNEKLLITLFIFIFITGWLVHISEVLIFAILFGVILFLNSISRERKLHFSLAMISCLFAVLIISEVLPKVGLFQVGFGETSFILMYLIFTTVISFKLQKIVGPFHKVVNHIPKIRNVGIAISLLALFLWIFAFYNYIQNEQVLWSLRSVIESASMVPWYIYPVRLGIIGLLAVLALLFSGNIKKFSPNNWVVVFTFVILAAVLLFVGKTLTLVQLFYYDLNYFEIAVVRYFLYGVLALIAAVFLTFILSSISKRIMKRKIVLKLIVAILVSTIFVSGTASTLLSIDHWADQPSSFSLDDSSVIQGVFAANPSLDIANESFVSVDSSSNYVLSSLGVKVVSNPMDQIITFSDTPEAYYFGSWFTSAKYLYYSPKLDSSTLQSQNSFLYSALQLNDLGPQDNDTMIYALPTGVPPTSNSQVLFILPTGSSYNTVLETLAKSNMSYTIALPNALTSLNYSKIVLPYDPLEVGLGQKLLEKVEEGSNLLIYNVDKTGYFAQMLNLTNSQGIKIAPIVPSAAWNISIGQGEIKSSMEDGQAVVSISGLTDTNGLLRIDRVLDNQLDLTNASSLSFKFKSNSNPQSVRLVLFDSKGNYEAFNFPYTSLGTLTTFNVDLNDYTDRSGNFSLLSVNRIRVGINGNANSTCSCSFSDITAILKPQNISANAISDYQQNVSLPSSVITPILNIANASAVYLHNNSPVSPLIYSEDYGSGEITYVNLMPLSDNQTFLSEILPKIERMNQGMTNLPEFNMTKDGVSQQFEMYAAKITAQGVATIGSNSILPISGFNFSSLELNCLNATFSINATKLVFTPSNHGSYSTIELTSPFTLSILNNGQQVAKYNITDDCTFLVKDPQIAISGQAQMDGAYWRKNSANWGATLIFYGTTNFNIPFSTENLILFDFQHVGNFRSLTQNVVLADSYAELEQVTLTIFLSITVFIIIIVSGKATKKQLT